MSLTDPNTIFHAKTMMLFAALYYVDIIHPLLDASGRAAAQMTNTDSHNGERRQHSKCYGRTIQGTMKNKTFPCHI